MVNPWIEAMRLRTLPVSVAGVVIACGLSIKLPQCRVSALVLCLLFAVLAQIASNFANEYYDFKAGLDKPGREGPRRGVTEGDITPLAMRNATFLTLALACVVGLSLVAYGGWWLIAVGVMIAVGVLAYSTGPYPLSRHALGELAVVFFFGIIPVNLTVYVATLSFSTDVALASVAIGLMGANVLIVNNYRDADADAAVGKITIAVKFGRKFASTLYLVNGLAAIALTAPLWYGISPAALIVPALFVVTHVIIFNRLLSLRGRSLTPLLGMTAVEMLLFALSFTILTILY